VPAETGLPDAEQFCREHEIWLGSCAQWFVRTVWAQAAIWAFNESRKVFQQSRRYTKERLEDACRRALLYDLRRVEDIESILAQGLDRLPLDERVGPTGQRPEVDA
jgi:hypothetical protein